MARRPKARGVRLALCETAEHRVVRSFSAYPVLARLFQAEIERLPICLKAKKRGALPCLSASRQSSAVRLAIGRTKTCWRLSASAPWPPVLGLRQPLPLVFGRLGFQSYALLDKSARPSHLGDGEIRYRLPPPPVHQAVANKGSPTLFSNGLSRTTQRSQAMAIFLATHFHPI